MKYSQYIIKPVSPGTIPPSRFIYAGDAYVLDRNAVLYKEVLFSGNTELNGLFSGIKKAFKKVGNVVKKVASNPVVKAGIGVASYMYPGVAALQVASAASTVSSYVVNKEAANKAVKEAKAASEANIKAMNDAATLTMPTAKVKKLNVDKTGTDAIQAYNNYLKAGGTPGNVGDITEFGTGDLTMPILISGGIIMVAAIMSNRG